MEKEKVMEFINILMEINIEVNGKMMKKLLDNINLMMVALLMVASKEIKLLMEL